MRKRSRQEFDATIVQRHTDRRSRLMWFSTQPEPASQVCLLVSALRRAVRSSAKRWNLELELNGQENFRTGRAVERIDASPEALRIGFRQGHGVHTGHVDASEARTVREIAVRFRLSRREADHLKAMLDVARHDGCQVRFRAGRRPSPARSVSGRQGNR